MRQPLIRGISIVIFTLLLRTPFASAMPIPFELFHEAEPHNLRTQLWSEDRPEVNHWVHYFSIHDHARFDRFLWRGALYKNLIEDILVENAVPAEMYYLAMIESGFSRSARSQAHAVGVWQFGAATGRLYGLRIDREVDERLDIIRATEAAAHHLKILKSDFGSWYLAMAAYNCGIGCVRKAVRRGRSKDFWRLARRGYLPAETANYVPKFEAAMKIAKHPEKYGFVAKACYDFPGVLKIRVNGRVNLSEIAIAHRVSVQSVLALNPHLIRGKTPTSRHGYEVWLPRSRRLSRQTIGLEILRTDDLVQKIAL